MLCAGPWRTGRHLGRAWRGCGRPVQSTVADHRRQIRSRRGGGRRAESDDEDEPQGPLKLAIVGRPTAGKSTLIKRMLGEERLLPGPEEGDTRNSNDGAWRR